MHHRAIGVSLFVVLLTAMPSVALAQEAPPPPPAERPDPGAHLHDGFYLRMGLGGGGLHDSFQLTNAGAVSGDASGPSGSLELAAGGAIVPGVILGGALFFESVQSPKITVLGETQSSDIHVGTLGMIGPFVDWYLNPRKGFHLQGAIGAARITLRDGSGAVSDQSPVGGGLVLGVGYEWWIGDDWGLGVMGRFTGARLTDNSLTHDVQAGSVLATLTFN